MIKFLKKFLLFPFLLLQACFSRFSGEVDKSLSDSYYYASRSGKIIYSPMGNWFSLGYDELDADPATFRVLARNFGKDKDFSFYKNNKLLQVDHPTFEVENHVIKDKNHVYAVKDYFEIKLVKGADPKSFGYIDADNPYSSWAKDDFHYFYDHIKVDVDFESFRILDNELVADKNFIYEVIPPKEEEASLPAEAQNAGEGILLKRDTLKDEEVRDIRDITSVYARMGQNIYANHSQKGFHKTAFEQITQVQVVDKECIIVNETLNKTLLVQGEKFPYEGVDIASFEPYKNFASYVYTRDKNHVYYEGQVLPGARPSSFEVLGFGYAKDENHVYYLDELMEGVNPRTFTYDEKKFEWRDGNTVYREGKPYED